VIPLDYFVAGPTIALESRLPMGPPSAPRLDLAVLKPPDREVGRLFTVVQGDHIALDAQWAHTAAEAAHAVEALRLAARVLRKLSPLVLRVARGPTEAAAVDALLADGFCREAPGRWYVPPTAPRAPVDRAGDLRSLYADPYRVIWSFEPRPWDVLAPLLSTVGRTPATELLDVGCGFGKNARLLEDAGLGVHGIDVAPAALSIARRWVRHPERFVEASLDALPYPDARFDAVLDVGCLHCLPADRLAAGLGEITRVLRPGGWLFSRVLRPRDPAWIQAQAFRVATLGLEPRPLADALAPGFEVGWSADAEATRLWARRRPASDDQRRGA
jgi:SAM-dependent methyltransferase